MKWFLLYCAFCIPCFAYWDDLRYCSDIKEHKQEFRSWVAKRGWEMAYSRVLLTLSCDDSDDIPKHEDAGKVFENAPVPYQVMHNGIKVLKDGYCASWMTDLIYGLKGHHEPQEEKIFYETLKYMPEEASMLELGSYWGYYSLWFAQSVKKPLNFLIEPDEERLNLGRINFSLNAKTGHFVRGFVGSCNTDAGNIVGARSIEIDAYLHEVGLNHLTLLHADIQGSEYEMLLTASHSIQEHKIDYLFISTHSEKLHADCISFLLAHDYIVIVEHSPLQSYSVDGLVVAKRKELMGPETIQISKKACYTQTT